MSPVISKRWLSRPWALAASLAAAALLVALPGRAPAQPAVAAVPSVEQLVDGVQARYEKVTDFKANFRQVVKRKHLPRPLNKRGMVYFKKPGMMRWDYTQPEKVYYVSDGSILWSYQAEDKLAYKMNVKESELYGSLKFLFGQGNLRGEFNIARGKAEGGTVALELTPKVAQSNYKKLVLLVDPKTFEIRETELVDPLDNVSRVTFENIKYETLDPKGFKFEPPKGVRVQDLQSPGGTAGDPASP